MQRLITAGNVSLLKFSSVTLNDAPSLSSIKWSVVALLSLDRRLCGGFCTMYDSVQLVVPGVTEPRQFEIFRVLSGILHLGNVMFSEDDKEVCTIPVSTHTRTNTPHTHHSFMQRPVHPSFGLSSSKNEYGWVEIWTGGGWVNTWSSKKSSKTIDIVSYALKVSVNGVTCVFVVLFRSKKFI